MVTERLYLNDSYLTEFSAKVVTLVEREGRPVAILDGTCFYPSSGGQPCDLGTLDGVPVVDVLEEEKEVVHVLERPLPQGTEVVTGSIDWERRFDHMQQHTGQHILSQTFLRVFGAETVSFHMGREVSTIDLDVSSLAEEEVARAEEAANGEVFADREVRTSCVAEGEVAQLGVRGGTPDMARVRIVEIVNFDRVACGGTHCRTTGEVGLVKVHRWGKVRGKQRVEFSCGRRALLDYQLKEGAVQAIARLQNVSECDVVETVQRGAEELRNSRKRIEELVEELLGQEAEFLMAGADQVGECRVVCKLFHGREVREVRKLVGRITARPGFVALLGVVGEKGNLIFGRSEDLGFDLLEAMKACCSLGGGRGGGRPNFAQGGVDSAKIQQCLEQGYITLFG